MSIMGILGAVWKRPSIRHLVRFLHHASEHALAAFEQCDGAS